MVNNSKKKKPEFNVLNYGFKKCVKKRWRKPRGTHNKKRMKFQWTGASPKVGYRNPEAVRGTRPDGKKEVLVRSLGDLEALKGADVVVRIASAIGARKRKLVVDKAKELKLTVANMGASKPPSKAKYGAAKTQPQKK